MNYICRIIILNNIFDLFWCISDFQLLDWFQSLGLKLVQREFVSSKSIPVIDRFWLHLSVCEETICMCVRSLFLNANQYYFMVAQSSTFNFCFHFCAKNRTKIIPKKRKKIIGTGDVVSVLFKFVRPSKEVRDKYPVRAHTHQL